MHFWFWVNSYLIPHPFKMKQKIICPTLFHILSKWNKKLFALYRWAIKTRIWLRQISWFIKEMWLDQFCGVWITSQKCQLMMTKCFSSNFCMGICMNGSNLDGAKNCLIHLLILSLLYIRSCSKNKSPKNCHFSNTVFGQLESPRLWSKLYP